MIPGDVPELGPCDVRSRRLKGAATGPRTALQPISGACRHPHTVNAVQRIPLCSLETRFPGAIL